MSALFSTGFSKLARFSYDFILCWTEKRLKLAEKAVSAKKLCRSFVFMESLDMLDFGLLFVSTAVLAVGPALVVR